MINAVLLTPNLTLGGAERWIVSMVKYAMPDRLRWTGVAVSGWGGAEKNLCDEVASRVPLHCNLVPHADRRHSRPFHYASFPRGFMPIFAKAVRHAARGAEIAVAWGSPEMVAGALADGIPIVLTSHTTEAGTGRLPLRPDLHYAAVSPRGRPLFRTTSDESCPARFRDL